MALEAFYYETSFYLFQPAQRRARARRGTVHSWLRSPLVSVVEYFHTLFT